MKLPVEYIDIYFVWNGHFFKPYLVHNASQIGCKETRYLLDALARKHIPLHRADVPSPKEEK